MSYSTKEDLLEEISEDELAQLCDATELIGDAKTTKINSRFDKANTAADSEIDSYLQKHYAIPLVTVPNIIRQKSTANTLYYMWSSRANRSGMDETVKDNFEKNITWLKLVARKEVGIGIDPLPGSPSSTSEPVKVKTNVRKFTQDSLKRM